MKMTSKSIEDELDALTDILRLNLENTDNPNHVGVCRKCVCAITSEGEGCSAMGDMYHVRCFVCAGCGRMLMGLPFFHVQGTPYCCNCHDNLLHTCVKCHHKITDSIVTAVGKSYHTDCFTCVKCRKNLDGVPFTVDGCETIYCIDCYQVLYSPRCAVCTELIMPTQEDEGTVHIVAMGMNLHTECYRCEVCDVTLSVTGDGCYVDGHLLCQKCNAISRTNVTKKVVTRNVTTDL